MMFVTLSLSVSLVLLGASGVPLDGNAVSSQSKEWDILKLTQSWPPAICIYVENEKKKCEISSNITSWVIHGLWPTETGTEGPNYCNDTWKFDVSKVKPLRPRLDMNWPSITLGDKPEESWEHEWVKHGTCSAALPTLKGELLYFNGTLNLHSHFNLSLFLMQNGINPSNNRSYQAENILTSLQKSLGVLPTIVCVKEKKTGKFYMEQIEICLDKSFKAIDCKSSETSVHQPQSFTSVSDLLFRSERVVQSMVWRKDVLRDNVHGCGSGEVYYKPMPPH